MTVESFLVACKRSQLSIQEMDLMTVGMCLDYAFEYAGLNKEDERGAIRKANQKDFDSF